MPRPAVVLFAAMMVANVSNYFFQVLMSRLLGPASYSLLGSVLSFVTILGISLTALQTASAKSVAVRSGDGLASQGRDPLTMVAIRYGAVATLVVAGCSPLLAGFLHDGLGPGLALAAYVIPAALFAIGQGRLQGMQAFGLLAVVTVGTALGRVVISPVALALGLGVSGVVMVSVLVALVSGVWAIAASRYAGPTPVSSIRGDIFRASIALGLFWLMVGIDVPIARHFLRPEVAGQYAVASILGKAILWLPVAFSTVMFPRVASRRRRGEHPHPPLVQAIALTVVLCTAAIGVLYLFGPRFIPVFFGHNYSPAGKLAWKLGAICLPFALANVLIFYHLTRETIGFLAALGVSVALESAAFTRFHGSVDQIIAGMGFAGILLLLTLGGPGVVRVVRRSWSARDTGSEPA